MNCIKFCFYLWYMISIAQFNTKNWNYYYYFYIVSLVKRKNILSKFIMYKMFYLVSHTLTFFFLKLIIIVIIGDICECDRIVLMLKVLRWPYTLLKKIVLFLSNVSFSATKFEWYVFVPFSENCLIYFLLKL